MSTKIAYIAKDCVSCGTCLSVCPKSALSIYKGVYATVDEKKCVGCGKCVGVCPAAVIAIVERGAVI